MAYSLLFEETARVVLVRFEGVLGPGQFEALDVDTRKLAAQRGNCDGIVDFTAVTRVDIDMGYWRRLASRQRVMKGMRRLVVAPQPEMFGLARLYGLQQAAGTGADEPTVVLTLAEAFEFLDLKSPDFVPIAL